MPVADDGAGSDMPRAQGSFRENTPVLHTLIGIIILVLDIVALVSVLTGRGSVGHKVLWTLLILLLPVIGMLLYFLVGRSPEDA